jgi:hypothetical protein
MVPTRDGVRLATDVYRIQGAKPAPVLLARTPYDKERILCQFSPDMCLSVFGQDVPRELSSWRGLCGIASCYTNSIGALRVNLLPKTNGTTFTN